MQTVTIPERLSAFREEMRKKEIDIMLVLTADPHHSEYLSEHDKTRVWLSGFTGSAGTLVISEKEAVLFTDGRYFIQAEHQLKGSGISLMRMRVPGVPTLEEYVAERAENARIGVDFAMLDAKSGAEYSKLWKTELVDSGDMFDIWTDRPALPNSLATWMPVEIAGESVHEKLTRIRAKMQEASADAHVLSVLDDIAWTLNIRGNDIKNTPVTISYLYVDRQTALWFVDGGKVSEELAGRLLAEGVEIREYGDFFPFLEGYRRDARILVEMAKTSLKVTAALDGCELIDGANPSYLMKCIKNETEIRGLIRAHEQDGVAVTRFMYWLKHHEGPLGEIEAEEKLEGFRKEQPEYLSPSFDTICAYGKNAAMMHYKAMPGVDAAIEKRGFLLIDSGGQYVSGTTDITRTFAMGPLSDVQRMHFTAVLRSVIRLASAHFLSGMAGKGLDVLARGPIWDLGIDYRCGTGHGVGFRLGVHEGPNSFRWHSSPLKMEETVIQPGMVTTDEPGIYLEEQYGIRTENELLCKVREENEYGTFLEFETVTYVPVDLDAVVPEQMSQEERNWLNQYHAEVYRRMLPHMADDNEKEWLKYATRAI